MNYQEKIDFYTRRMGDIRRKHSWYHRIRREAGRMNFGHPTDGMLLLNFATQVARTTRLRDQERRLYA